MQQPIQVLLLADQTQAFAATSKLLDANLPEAEFRITFVLLAAEHTQPIVYPIAHSPFDLILLDLAEKNHIERICQLRSMGLQQPIVGIGHEENRSIVAALIEAGTQEYLVRTELTAYWLRHALHHAIERSRRPRLGLEQAEQVEPFNPVQAIAQDIPQNKREEERVRQQDRLAIVGQLAAGIAHDFNNILSIITSYVQMLLKSPDLPPKEQQRLQIIHEQTQRAAQLITQILDFSRQSVLEQQPVKIALCLTDLVHLLRRTLPESIQIDLVVSDQMLLVQADIVRLQQVFMNLAVNARDAMPNGGRLFIQAKGFNFTDAAQAPSAKMTPGDWVQIALSDTGHGIPLDALPHIFEPFFSTKHSGKGTGLGLAQVYDIIQQHGGFIRVTSQVGKGSTFTIYLPALSSVELQPPTAKATLTFTGQGETILVVEDDPLTCEALADSLRLLNYQVLTASNGKEALKLFDQYENTQYGNAIALVLSDLVMPLMDGKRLFKQLRQKRANLKLILMTGYPADQQAQALMQAGVNAWLPKPFEVEQVAQVIHQTITC